MNFVKLARETKKSLRTSCHVLSEPTRKQLTVSLRLNSDRVVLHLPFPPRKVTKDELQPYLERYVRAIASTNTAS